MPGPTGVNTRTWSTGKRTGRQAAGRTQAAGSRVVGKFVQHVRVPPYVFVLFHANVRGDPYVLNKFTKNLRYSKQQASSG